MFVSCLLKVDKMLDESRKKMQLKKVRKLLEEDGLIDLTDEEVLGVRGLLYELVEISVEILLKEQKMDVYEAVTQKNQ
jgi:hypothetical protein